MAEAYVLTRANIGKGLAASSALCVEAISVRERGQSRYSTGYNHSGAGFDTRINRNTGRPHEHKREIARRLRQSARALAKAGAL